MEPQNINKTLSEKVAQGRQYRSLQLQTRANQEGEEKKYIVEGYATTFNEPYVLYSDDDFEIREQVSPDAFKTSDLSDVIFQYDHCGRVYARLSNKTLELNCDEHGLFVRADLGGTEEGRKLYEEINGGYTNKMSFGFTIEEEDVQPVGEENGKEIYLRTITKVGRLFDVSAVSIPANDGTEISARGFVDGVIAKRELESSQKKEAEAEQKRIEEEQKRLAEDKARKERERLALELSFSFSK